jgi:beta-lactamase class A
MKKGILVDMAYSYWKSAYDVPGQQLQTVRRNRTLLVFAAFGVALLLVTTIVLQQIESRLMAVDSVDQGLAVLPEPSGNEPESAVLAAHDDFQGGMAQDAAMKWISDQQDSTWGVYVGSVDTGKTLVDINSDKPFELASIYKLFLLQPLAERVPSSQWATTPLDSKNYRDCVVRMLSVSDNPCAETFAQILGWGTIDRRVREAGYRGTDLNRTDYLAGTAADTAELLRRLYSGNGYDDQLKNLALGALKTRSSSEAIRNACPECTVYNKTGQYNGMHNDAAIVEKDGQVYTIVIFSKNSNWQQATQLATRIIELL